MSFVKLGFPDSSSNLSGFELGPAGLLGSLVFYESISISATCFFSLGFLDKMTHARIQSKIATTIMIPAINATCMMFSPSNGLDAILVSDEPEPDPDEEEADSPLVLPLDEPDVDGAAV